MSTSRTMIEILTFEFEKNAGLKKTFQQISKDALEERYAIKRVFDRLPSLLSEKLILQLTDEFKKILNEISPKEVSENKFELHLPSDQTLLMNFEKKIIKIGCEEILTIDGKIKEELKTLLAWEEDLTQEKVCDVIYAFVGAINQDIMQNAQQEIINDKKSYNALCSLVNQECGKWMIDTMNSSNYIFDHEAIKLVNSTSFFSILQTMSLSQKVGFGVGIITFLTVGIGLAYNFFNSQNNKTMRSEKPQIKLSNSS